MSSIPITCSTIPAEAVIDVSIVIPVYNCARYLHETIGSVRDQGLQPSSYEILAVDDGSTDGSLQVLRELAKDCDDLQVFSIPNSGSAAAPRNLGLENSHGRYVFFLDADDKLEPGALPRLISIADNTGSGVVLCKMGPFGEGDRAGQVPTAAFGRTRFAVDFLEAKASSTLGSWKLFRRSILTENNIRFPLGYTIGEDQPFTMKAYLHSPHVSILADRIYYWLRGRDDGSNVTSVGQPPGKHLIRIMTLMRTILDNTEPGVRRDQLLRRPLIGSAGVTSVFGKKMLPAHGRDEREAMLSAFSPLVTPLWNANVRKHANVDSQLLIDLATRNDLDEIERVSALLQAKKPIPLEFDSADDEFVYIPSRGEPIKDLNVSLHSDLKSLAISGTTVHMSGDTGIDGLDSPPDATRLVIAHRKLGKELKIDLESLASHTRRVGTRTAFETRLDLSELTDFSVWDVFIEANWGQTSLRQKLGSPRPKILLPAPTAVGNPTSAVVFFSKSNGLAFDVGPTEKHMGAGHLGNPQILGRYMIDRTEAVVLSGAVRRMSSVQAVPHSGSHPKTVRFEVHSEFAATVFVPHSVVKKREYSFCFTDRDGAIHEIADS